MAGISRLASFRLSPRGRTILTRGVALVGFGLLAKTLSEVGIVHVDGLGGTDATDYWVAGRHVAAGEPLYAAPYGTYLAYSYPPVFAQLLSPITLLPQVPFVWLWRAVELACLRLALGSWTRAGIALLFPPVISEIETGNVHLVMAAVCALAMRGSAAPAAPAALLKFASAPLLPLAWVLDRRGLLRGLALAIGVVAVSVALAPAYWSEYATFLSASDLPVVPAVVLTILPLPVRLMLAAFLGVLALRYVRLAPVAVVLAYPVVWASSLSTLVAIAAPVAERSRLNVRWPVIGRRAPAAPGTSAASSAGPL